MDPRKVAVPPLIVSALEPVQALSAVAFTAPPFTVNVPAPSDEEFVAFTVPSETIRPPANELEAPRLSVPAPALVRTLLIVDESMETWKSASALEEISMVPLVRNWDVEFCPLIALTANKVSFEPFVKKSITLDAPATVL